MIDDVTIVSSMNLLHELRDDLEFLSFHSNTIRNTISFDSVDFSVSPVFVKTANR